MAAWLRSAAEMADVRVTIVLPTYNERDNVRVLVPAIEAAFADVAHEVLVVDDASPDGTAAATEGLAKEYPAVRLVLRRGREGLGAALRDGYDRARGALILSSDSDGTFSPALMRRLYDACTPDVDFVVGVREQPAAAWGAVPWRVVVQRFCSRVGNWGFQRITGAPVRSFSVNFRIIRAAAWKRLDVRESSNAFLVEMISAAARAGLRIRELPVAFGDRLHGESKFRLSREGPRFVRVALRLAARRWVPAEGVRPPAG